MKECDCPTTVNVTGPSMITPIGDTMIFTASVIGGDQPSVNYNWSVSAGTIVSGQGTSSITVATNSDLAGQTITATAEATGFCDTCPSSLNGSASGEVAQPQLTPVKIDELGPMTPDDMKKRLEALGNALASDPSARGFIVNRGGTAREKAKRNRDLAKAIEFLRIDTSRLTIVDGGGSGTVNSEIWVVPAGADNPSY